MREKAAEKVFRRRHMREIGDFLRFMLQPFLEILKFPFKCTVF